MSGTTQTRKPIGARSRDTVPPLARNVSWSGTMERELMERVNRAACKARISRSRWLAAAAAEKLDRDVGPRAGP